MDMRWMAMSFRAIWCGRKKMGSLMSFWILLPLTRLLDQLFFPHCTSSSKGQIQLSNCPSRNPMFGPKCSKTWQDNATMTYTEGHHINEWPNEPEKCSDNNWTNERCKSDSNNRQTHRCTFKIDSFLNTTMPIVSSCAFVAPGD